MQSLCSNTSPFGPPHLLSRSARVLTRRDGKNAAAVVCPDAHSHFFRFSLWKAWIAVTRHFPLLQLAFCCALVPLVANAAPSVTPAEMALKNDWVTRNLLTATNTPPFSFFYNGLSSASLLSFWTRVQTDSVLDAYRTQHVITWTNAGIPLQVRCVAVEYSDYPVVEWTVYLKNIGASSTPLITNIEGLDTTFTRSSAPEYVLNGIKGDSMTADSYQPFQLTLYPLMSTNFAPLALTGKSTTGESGWPYWNLQVPGGGTIMAVGWPGQWSASFVRNISTSLRVYAGQQLTSLSLAPGEQIRTPSSTLFFWQGTDVVRSQNLWRRFYRAHIMPAGTTPILAVLGDSPSTVNSYISAGIHPDILWQDAGWYPVTGPYAAPNTWLNTGNWFPDPPRYPAGFKPASDAVHNLGTKFLLWVEPERVGAPTNCFLGTNHPDWLLQPGSVGLILNEGHPAAFNWMTNHFDTLIKTNGVDWYREDMNGDGPCSSWRANDAANRQGMTENLYVQGHLAYWDALLAMNPGLRIDSCASGGRRNDLETMRRAVPLLRSDFQFPDMPNVVDGNQGHTYGLSSWLPFNGSGSYFFDKYSYRTFYLSSFVMAAGLDVNNTPAQQQAYGECKKVAPIMLYGDYYPITPYSIANTAWIAWQFDRPDTGEGMLQAFRRSASTVPSMQFQFHELNSNYVYQVQDFDLGILGNYTGAQLMSTGLVVQLPQQGSVVLYYKVIPLIVAAMANPPGGTGPLNVQFTTTTIATNPGPVTYSWTFGDGDTSTNQNPSHLYNISGRYSAQVIAQDGGGNLATGKVSVSVFNAAKKMKVTFPGYTRAETLSNFPALVVLGSNLSTNGFAYDQLASTNGYDLLFTDASGTQELNYEIESWNTNGNSHVWVQVPQLTSNSFVWAFWGDSNRASAPASYVTNGLTWNNGYVSVWHLSEPRGFARDSVAQSAGVVWTTYGSCMRGVPGEVASAYSFGGGYVTAGAATLPSGSNTRTVSAWFKKNAAATASPGKEIFGYGNNNVGQRFAFWVGGSGTANTLGVENCGAGRLFPWTWDNQWHHLVAVLPSGQNDISALQLYYDGALNNSATGSGQINTAQDELCFAAIPTVHSTDRTYDFDGSVDEVRISNVARSANWLWAEWLNSASNTVFSGYGAVTTTTSPLAPFQITQLQPLPGNQLALTWQSVSGRTYTIEGATNLSSTPFWSTIATNIPGSASTTSWTGQLNSAEFLRVKAE